MLLPHGTLQCRDQWSLYVPHSGHYMYRTVVTICTASGHCMNRTVVTMYRTVVTVCTAQWSLCTAQWLLYVPPVVTICTASGHCMYRTVVTICTASGYCMYRTVVTIYTAQWSLYVPQGLTHTNPTYCPHSCIYVFCVDLRTNSHYFPIQH